MEKIFNKSHAINDYRSSECFFKLFLVITTSQNPRRNRFEKSTYISVKVLRKNIFRKFTFISPTVTGKNIAKNPSLWVSMSLKNMGIFLNFVLIQKSIPSNTTSQSPWKKCSEKSILKAVEIFFRENQRKKSRKNTRFVTISPWMEFS